MSKITKYLCLLTTSTITLSIIIVLYIHPYFEHLKAKHQTSLAYKQLSKNNIFLAQKHLYKAFKIMPNDPNIIIPLTHCTLFVSEKQLQNTTQAYKIIHKYNLTNHNINSAYQLEDALQKTAGNSKKMTKNYNSIGSAYTPTYSQKYLIFINRINHSRTIIRELFNSNNNPALVKYYKNHQISKKLIHPESHFLYMLTKKSDNTLTSKIHIPDSHQIFGPSADAWRLLINSYYQSTTKEKLQHLSNIMSYEPANPFLAFEKYLLLKQLGENDLAYQSLLIAANGSKFYLKPRFTLAKFYLDNHQMDKAAKTLSQLPKEALTHPASYMLHLRLISNQTLPAITRLQTENLFKQIDSNMQFLYDPQYINIKTNHLTKYYANHIAISYIQSIVKNGKNLNPNTSNQLLLISLRYKLDQENMIIKHMAHHKTFNHQTASIITATKQSIKPKWIKLAQGKLKSAPSFSLLTNHYMNLYLDQINYSKNNNKFISQLIAQNNDYPSALYQISKKINPSTFPVLYKTLLARLSILLPTNSINIQLASLKQQISNAGHNNKILAPLALRLNKICTQHKRNAQAKILLAHAFISLHNFKQAGYHLTQAAKIDPTTKGLSLHLLLTYIKTQSWINPNRLFACYYNISKITHNSKTHTDLNTYLKTIEFYALKNNNHILLTKIYTHLLRKSPGNIDYQNNLAYALAQRQKTLNQARERIRLLKLKYPDNISINNTFNFIIQKYETNDKTLEIQSLKG